MQVTLIRPPVYTTGLIGPQLVPYLGVTYIAAAARQAGHIVDIVDMCGEDIDHTEVINDKYISYGMSFSSLRERIKPSELIGFTCTFSQEWVFHRELIGYVHRFFPESIFVAGGEHVSALPEYCLDDCPELDICIIGEGEEVFVRLLDALVKKGRISEVPSLVYRSSNGGGYCCTPRGTRIRGIDKIPLPAWDLIPLENYLSRGLNYHVRRGRTIPMLMSRGCPYQCTFCSNANMWGNPWIMRNTALVADEMGYYINHYKVTNFVFSDLTAVVNKESIVNLCNEIINRKMNVTWQLPTLRTEAVDRQVLELMYHAGCRELDFAIESGSRKILDSVNKKNNPQKMVSLIKDGLHVGINLCVNIVIGLPQEGIKDFLITYKLVIKLALIGLQELNVFPFVPYPGSRLFEEFVKDKKIILNNEFFLSLFGYADLRKAISWSSQFTPITLSVMRLVLLVSFYGLMFISHPRRLLKFIINIISGAHTTKLEVVLERIFKNVKISFFYKPRLAGENI